MQNYFMGQDGFSWFIGVIEDREDPEKAGRVRVRCMGYHTADTQEIPKDDLPWASVMMPVTAGGNSGIGFSPHFLIEGTWVVGFFRDPAKQEPVIMGALPGVNTANTSNNIIADSSAVGGFSSPMKGGGFKDPKGKYPTSLYLTKPDTNLLAQESTDTHPSKSVKDSTDSWSTASGSAEQPASTQSSAKYPTNHVLETESGHYVEFDDTTGNERIHIYHTKGTFVEIDSSGNVVIKTVGNVTNIVAGNMDTYVAGNYSLTCTGTMDISAGKLVTEKFDKGRKTTITGEETLEVAGNLTTTITQLGSIKASGAMTVGGSSISFN